MKISFLDSTVFNVDPNIKCLILQLTFDLHLHYSYFKFGFHGFVFHALNGIECLLILKYFLLNQGSN